VKRAERLFVTQATVKTHANHAMAKLGARDRAQLVVIAYETGPVQPGIPPTAPSAAGDSRAP
jgi:DNA-binding CsgD family transcriptional regulator